MNNRNLIVTIDTEVNKSGTWNISSPVSFSSVTRGIPEVLCPLFDKFGVRPTYLISPEVIEDDDCVRVLSGLGSGVELGTHLHGDFIEPNRTFSQSNMANAFATETQLQYSPEIEEKKILNLTNLFYRKFGYRPLSFRAGRLGISPNTLAILKKLGYQVDSSIAPGMFHVLDRNYQIDHRLWSLGPKWEETSTGLILELPLSYKPGLLLRLLKHFSSKDLRFLTSIFAPLFSYEWLRPSWFSAKELIHYLKLSPERFMVMMFHSTEICLGASPYSKTQESVERIIVAMKELFSYARDSGVNFCSLSEAKDILVSEK